MQYWKLIGVALGLAFCLQGCDKPPSAYKAPTVQELIAEERLLDDKCRGGSGDNSATQRSCDARDKLLQKIEALGWCWGPDGAIGADKKWGTCQPQRQAAVLDNGDPYAAGQEALGEVEYIRSKVALLARVRRTQFALKCRVIREVEATMIFETGVQRISDEEIGAGRSDYHPDLIPDVQAAATDANAKASAPGACDYWMKNPEEVAEIRREADIATSP